MLAGEIERVSETSPYAPSLHSVLTWWSSVRTETFHVQLAFSNRKSDASASAASPS